MKTKIDKNGQQPVAFIRLVEWMRHATGMGGGGGFSLPRKRKP